MAIEHTLTAQKRDKTGTAECRRLRRNGMIPGNVYGHKEGPVAIRVDEHDLIPLVLSGGQVVRVELEDRSETAVLRDVHWNTFGTTIEHFDLVRVDPDEKVTLQIAIDLRGSAPGVVAGGMLEQLMHELTLDCPAIDIPDRITVKVGDLQIGQAIHVGDLSLPESLHPHHEPDEVVVRVTEPLAVGEEVAGETPGAEPEVVGRAAKDEEDRD